MARRIVTGIDVGTYQVKVVIAEQSSGRRSKSGVPRILGTGYAESKGLRHGYIINEADVARSINSAVGQAEKAANVRVKRAYISMGGIGLDEIISRGEAVASRADSEVSDEDVERAIADAEERIAQEAVNKKVIHAIPLAYYIDGTKVPGRPQGLRGTKLAVDTLFILSFEQHLSDLISTIENLGISVDDVMASPLAGSLVMLTKAQKIAGCVLANIGAETVSIVVFENGTPMSLKVFPIGSKDVTNDIALGLKVSLEEAEQIKRGAITNSPYPKKKLDEIMYARLSDIFELIEAHLKKIKKNELLPAGIIITGGGSGIAAIEELAKTSLRLPSKIGSLNIDEKNTKIKDASWAVAYGLCMWGASGEHDTSGIKIARKTGNALLSWLRQFMP